MKLRKAIAVALAAAMLSGLFAGCGRGGRPSETTATAQTETQTTPIPETQTTPVSETQTTTAPPESQPTSTLIEKVPEGDYCANKIYVDGDTVIFVDPVTKFLSEGSLSAGSVKVLSQRKAYDRFIVTPEFIIYGRPECGTFAYPRAGGYEKRLCAREFYNGTLIDGTLYFVEKPMRLQGTELYTLQLDGKPELNGVMLKGNVHSYYHTSLVFSDRSVIYTAQPGIVQLELPAGKRTVLDESYGREPLTKEYIELNDDRLYPVYIASDNTITIPTEEYDYRNYDRYIFFEGDNMFSYYHAGICNITSGGGVVYDIPTEKIYDMLIDRQYVMIIYEGEDVYRIYDVGTLEVTEMKGNKAVRQPVSLMEYISGSENGVRLDPEEYAKLTPEEAAYVYYTAIRRQDRETLGMYYYYYAGEDRYHVYGGASSYIYRPKNTQTTV